MLNLSGFISPAGAGVVGAMMIVSALFVIAGTEIVTSWLKACPRAVGLGWQVAFVYYGWRGWTIIHTPITARAAFLWVVLFFAASTMTFAYVLSLAIKRAAKERAEQMAMELVAKGLGPVPRGPSPTPGPPLSCRPTGVQPSD